MTLNVVKRYGKYVIQVTVDSLWYKIPCKLSSSRSVKV